MSGHTPGPWAVEDPMGSDVGFWIVQDGLEAFQWSCIAMVTGDDEEIRSPNCRFITKEEQEANAKLLASAPELLEALRKAERHIALVSGNGETDLRAELNAAIAKATPSPSEALGG